MRNILSISKRELSGYFASPIAFVVIGIFLLLSSFFTFMVAGFFQRGEANLASFFTWFPWLFLFLVPAVGMGMWAEERRSGTMELLLTMPVSTFEAIIGKFIAAWIVVTIAIVLTFPVVITVNYLGTPDNGVIAAGYIGSVLLAGAYIAVTSMMSALTRSQVVSFLLAVVLLLFLVLAGYPPITDLFVSWADPAVVRGIASFSLMTHFDSIQKGVVDLLDILYFLSTIIFSLFTTGVIIRAHRAG
jgi:ABC-2 type transport system permease protein